MSAARATNALTQSSYGLLGARVLFNPAHGPLQVSIWGKNLTDEQYKARAVDFVTPGLGAIVYIPGDPRTYGASLHYEF